MARTTAVKKVKKSEPPQKERYLEAVGRRKTAVARVRLYPEEKKAKESVTINGRELANYFSLKRHREVVLAPFRTANSNYRVTVKIEGGGLNAQAEAVRLGIARALVALNGSFRVLLKQLGYLTRDPRMVERKHPGLRKARRAQQWRKR